MPFRGFRPSSSRPRSPSPAPRPAAAPAPAPAAAPAPAPKSAPPPKPAEPEVNDLCAHGDIKPKVYVIQSMGNRKMCWKWNDDGTTVQVTDECSNLDDPHTHFIFDTQMRWHSGVSQQAYRNCLNISSSDYKTGDLLKGTECGEMPTQQFLPDLNVYKKIFAGCPKGTTKPIAYYPSAYGTMHMLGSLNKCVGIAGSNGEFEGTNDLAIDECSPDLKDQDWLLTPVPPRGGGPRPSRSKKASWRKQVEDKKMVVEDHGRADVAAYRADDAAADAHAADGEAADEAALGDGAGPDAAFADDGGAPLHAAAFAGDESAHGLL